MRAVHEFRFEGNLALAKSVLKSAAVDELADFERLGRRKSDADDAAFQMETAYRNAGHAFARVDYRYEETQDKIIVTFLVEEGPLVEVKDIIIKGNSSFPSADLLTFLEPLRSGILFKGKPLFVETQMSSGAAGIRDYYYQNGFLKVEVVGPKFVFSSDRTSVTASVEIVEGTRFLVSEVNFTGHFLVKVGNGDSDEAPNEPLSQALNGMEPGDRKEVQGQLKLLAESLEGKPYVPRRKLALRNGIVEIFGNLGYPDADAVVAENAGSEPGDVILDAEIKPGPLVNISGITIAGAEKTKDGFIRSRVEIQPGDKFTLKAKRESFRKLYRSGLFSKVDVSLAEGTSPNARNLVVNVEEAPSREIFLEPGWGSYEQLRLRGGFKNRNLLGTGRIARAEAGVSIKSGDVVVGATDPWFLDSEITADLPVYYRMRKEPSFTREEKGFSILFSRKMTSTIALTLGYDFRMTAITDIQIDADLENLDSGYNLASVKIQATYDTRNDVFIPTGGGRTTLALDTSETWLGSEVAFLRAIAGSRWFLSLTSRTVLGLRYDSGLIIPTGEQLSLPLGERFFNGGENTVRSFEESQLGPMDSGDPVGGYGMNVMSLELRQGLFGNWAGTLFLEYGNVSPNKSRAEKGEGAAGTQSQLISNTLDDFFADFRPSVGCGLQYLLPLGPARLDLAFNPDARENEASWAWHFSVGMAF